MTRARPRTCMFFFLALLGLLVFVAMPETAHGEPGDLAPSWEAEISASKSNVEGERQNLQEAQAELQEAQADGDSSYAESRQERVTYYEQRVAAAEAQVAAAKAGLAKQTEFDRQNEPQDNLREVREAIRYYEVLRDEASAAGDSATVELAEDELQGGVFGNGLYEQEAKAKKVRAAKEAAKNAVGGETTGPATTGGATNETTEETTTAEAAPAPPGDDGGGGNEAAPEPTPEAPDEAPAGDGQGFLSGVFGGLNIVPILAFLALVAGGIFALSRSAGMSVRGFFSPAMASVKKTTKPAPKKPKPKKEAVAMKPQEPPEMRPEIEAPEDELETKPERQRKPRPEPGAGEAGNVTAEELEELFNQDDDELPDDEEPPK